ncbi:MAG: hypothetical protein Q8874_02880, partial [Sweet potato little leaf phytoplasma]|nr:hypothetical protein [Sweet potato little leaf phytoplasma]
EKPLYEMNLNIECNPEHKTLGFLLKLEHDQKLNEFYLTFNFMLISVLFIYVNLCVFLCLMFINVRLTC